MKTLILSGGKIDYTRLPFGMHQSNATIPVNGKPVISWILDDLIQKGIKEVSMVIRCENQKLKQLLEKHYSKRLQVTLIPVKQPTSILDSLKAGLDDLGSGSKPIQIILGDTLIKDSFENMEDTLYISEVKNSENWCIIESKKNSEISVLHDKKKLLGSTHFALCGYYQFKYMDVLHGALEKSIRHNNTELSAVLLYYNEIHPLKTKVAENWFDFGHLETLIQSKKKLLRPRHFNSLSIDPVLNTITKVSRKSDKLQDELDWYQLLPESLKILTPRLLTSNDAGNTITISQEYYGYPALSELFVYGDISLSVWESIIEYLFQVHNLFKQYFKEIPKQALHEMYTKKTHERIDQLLTLNDYWKSLWHLESVSINGVIYPNIKTLLKHLEPAILDLSTSVNGCIIHGDYCLSNILYDLNNQIVRLIDPRGSFGEKGIYGDPRYDIAKLRHSICGLYDYIIGDLFVLKETNRSFEYAIFEDEKNNALAGYFDTCLTKHGYRLNEIQLIEGLLFLSMIPYHADFFERQQMMYIKSILILHKLTQF